MLKRLKIKNYRVFDKEIVIDFTANMHIKRLIANTIQDSNQNILKTLCIYGPNNTGKTCLVLALRAIRTIMLNEMHEEFSNAFLDDDVTSISVEFIINKTNYLYEAEYNSKMRIYIKEELSIIQFNSINNQQTRKIKVFDRANSIINIIDHVNDKPKRLIINNIANEYPVMKALNLNSNYLSKIQKDYIAFASSIEIVLSEHGIDLSKTLDLIRNDEKGLKFVKSFVRNCDLKINDFGYSETITSDVDIDDKIAMMNPYLSKEPLKLWSQHDKYKVPSFIFDSIGTQKIIALSGYIYDAIKNGKILIIDELDSSLHHIISRALVSIFNNYLNDKSQLVFTTHDVALMDLIHLFRKDQIYLTDIDNENNIIVRHLLDNYGSRDIDGVRGTEDIKDFYIKGRFKGIPTPDLYDSVYGEE